MIHHSLQTDDSSNSGFPKSDLVGLWASLPCHQIPTPPQVQLGPNLVSSWHLIFLAILVPLLRLYLITCPSLPSNLLPISNRYQGTDRFAGTRWGGGRDHCDEAHQRSLRLQTNAGRSLSKNYRLLSLLDDKASNDCRRGWGPMCRLTLPTV